MVVDLNGSCGSSSGNSTTEKGRRNCASPVLSFSPGPVVAAVAPLKSNLIPLCGQRLSCLFNLLFCSFGHPPPKYIIDSLSSIYTLPLFPFLAL